MNTQPATATRPACPTENPPSCHPPFCPPRSATPRRSSTTPSRTSSGAPGPSSGRSGKVSIWIILAGVLGVVMVGGVAAWLIIPGMFARQRDDVIYFDVKEEPLEITVVERGALEA